VLAVGGTVLHPTSTGYTESVWNTHKLKQDATTSGCSTEYPMPSWQAPLLAGSGCAKRATADLSAASDFVDALGTASHIATY
jgi:hypothetical protein